MQTGTLSGEIYCMGSELNKQFNQIIQNLVIYILREAFTWAFHNF